MGDALDQTAPIRTWLTDPPWECASGGGGRGAQEHYDLMPTADILRFHRMHVGRLAPDAFLWMWCTRNSKADAIYIASALGFGEVTDWTWVKCLTAEQVRKVAMASVPGLLTQAQASRQYGATATGQYALSAHEHLYLFKRGSIVRTGQWPTSVILEPADPVHSRKPEESYRIIEAVTPGPYLETFARQRRQGWASDGNQLPAEAGT